MGKVRALTRRTRHRTLEALLRQLNPVLRGWCQYFRHGVSKATFGYLDAFTWRRVATWLRKRHKRINWKDLYRRFLTGRPGNRPAENGIVMFDTTRSKSLDTGGARTTSPHHGRAQRPPRQLVNPGNPWSAGCVETCTSGAAGGPGKRTGSNPGTAPRPDPPSSAPAAGARS
ncbi:group II intron maturase-specific domain-containing protein [Saccharopolyspora spinosa]|uniref:group II intron maturase-specific domain-containing protein n=1 Tax=Saccharopolyspora spinosa TaxID=60894 RepID=UPI001ED95069|nr:group II intron maturase-specific domain-containing protein [Saccharopolyspora spinosa]